MSSRVRDALRERLPHNWSVTYQDGPSQLDGTHATLVKWVDWTQGKYMVCEIHEAYAEQAGTVDTLCDELMDVVYESFGDPFARNTTPLSRRQMEVGA